jgi:hypothetical protein
MTILEWFLRGVFRTVQELWGPCESPWWEEELR